MSAEPIPSRSVRLRRVVRQLHRWLGLLIAIQLLFWIGSGLLMSALSLDAVRGEDKVRKQPPAALSSAPALKPLAAVLEAHAANGVTAATLTTLLEQRVYRLETPAGPRLVDAVSGAVLSPLTADVAKRIARADYAGDAAVLAVDWVDQPETEVRGRPLPLWRARFDDRWNTALYISPATGQVVARRNDLWRIFDFVWMLHIMDYQEREDFNHPLLVTTAATALLFVITGLFMLGYSFKPRPLRP